LQAAIEIKLSLLGKYGPAIYLLVVAET
jgi:hypothetical protein